MTDAATKYPALMAYIAGNADLTKPSHWLAAMKEHEAQAFAGSYADVASDLFRAKADYSAAQAAKEGNHSTVPGNCEMGNYLGLPLMPGSGEPIPAYYMAGCVAGQYRLGVASRRAQAFIDQGRRLRVVKTRSKVTGEPISFATFSGADSIKIFESGFIAANDKQQFKANTGFAIYSTIEKLVYALEHDLPFGEQCPSDGSLFKVVVTEVSA